MWFITVFEKCEPSDQFIAEMGDQRCWGYFECMGDALFALHDNRIDMHEGCYDYAVLEKIGPGISSYAGERQFFRFDRSRNGYFEIEEPECLKRLVNFAIG